MTATKKQFDSVDQMVRALSEGTDFAQESEKYAAEREITHRLSILRSLKGMPQESIAKSMGCSQARISKLEAATDTSLRLGDLAKYLGAIDMDLRIVMSPKGVTMADEVKYHWARVCEILNRMVECAKDDPEICRGVACFHGDAAFNFLNMICRSANRLRLVRQDVDSDNIAVDVFGLDDDCHMCGCEQAGAISG